MLHCASLRGEGGGCMLHCALGVGGGGGGGVGGGGRWGAEPHSPVAPIAVRIPSSNAGERGLPRMPNVGIIRYVIWYQNMFVFLKRPVHCDPLFSNSTECNSIIFCEIHAFIIRYNLD